MGRPATTRITSPYGYSSGYVGFHNGVDFAHSDPSNTPVYAFRAGTVTFVGVSSAWSGRGRVVVIDHGNGVVSWSCHLSGTWVSAGQHVSEGDRVGTMGATGAVLGIHLHWMIYLNGVVVDPTPYLTSSSGGGITPFDPEEEDEDMAKNTYIAWMDGTVQHNAILNTGSGFFSEFQSNDGGYNTGVAQSFDLGGPTVMVSASHAAALKADCARTRAGGTASVGDVTVNPDPEVARLLAEQVAEQKKTTAAVLKPSTIIKG